MTDTAPTPTLRERWAAYQTENPNQRIRNAAHELGVSEAELVHLSDGVRRLHLDGVDQIGELLMAMESMGEVMALTRNDACVHEKTGVYRNVELMPRHKMGLVLDEQIDLRLFLSGWRHAFAVETPFDGGIDGLRRSIQFFSGDGSAIHKIFLTRKSDVAAYNQIVARFLHPNADTPLDIQSPKARPAEKPDADIDADGFLSDWEMLKDTHDFFPLMGRYGVKREQALRIAEGRFSDRLDLSVTRGLLDTAQSTQTPIMVFVGNRGCLQIHSGPVNKVKAHGPWYNVLDPGFNLHLNESSVASAWAVRKPTEDGDVNSVEMFDADGEMIVQFFGKRKPGIPELPEWLALANGLPRLNVAA